MCTIKAMDAASSEIIDPDGPSVAQRKAMLIGDDVRETLKHVGRMSGATSSTCMNCTRRRSTDKSSIGIGALYAVEKEIRGRSAAERRAARRERSGPLLSVMKPWIEQTLSTLSQRSATAKAFGYALTRWEALERFCDDGRIEIDNNAAERTLRCAWAQELFICR